MTITYCGDTGFPEQSTWARKFIA